MKIPSPVMLTNEVWMVPCKIDPKLKIFLPVGRPSSNSQQLLAKKLRNSWIDIEDQTLDQLMKQRNHSSWSCVAKELNMKVHSSVPVRTGKQCRERWINHLNPQLVKHEWSAVEDQLLLAKQEELGNKWCLIVKLFVGRTENQVKNRWRSLNKKLHFKSRSLEKKDNFDDLCDLEPLSLIQSLESQVWIENSYDSKEIPFFSLDDLESGVNGSSRDGLETEDKLQNVKEVNWEKEKSMWEDQVLDENCVGGFFVCESVKENFVERCGGEGEGWIDPEMWRVNKDGERGSNE